MEITQAHFDALHHTMNLAMGQPAGPRIPDQDRLMKEALRAVLEADDELPEIPDSIPLHKRGEYIMELLWDAQVTIQEASDMQRELADQMCDELEQAIIRNLLSFDG